MDLALINGHSYLPAGSLPTDPHPPTHNPHCIHPEILLASRCISSLTTYHHIYNYLCGSSHKISYLDPGASVVLLICKLDHVPSLLRIQE